MFEVRPFELAHILKAHKIPVRMTHQKSLKYQYRLCISIKTKCMDLRATPGTCILYTLDKFVMICLSHPVQKNIEY